MHFFKKIISLLANIAFLSIIITVIIFWYQNYETAKGKEGLLKAITKYNCAVADTIISTPSDDLSLLSNFFIVPFITEPYVTNLGFIYTNFGSSTNDHILRAIGGMSEAENLMQIVRSTTVGRTFNQVENSNIVRFNANIKTIAPEVKKDLKIMFSTLDICN